MPQYTIKHKESGKTITFNWNGENPPTEEDLQKVYSEALKPQEKTWGQWAWEQAPIAGMTLGALLSRGGGTPGLLRRAGMAGAGGELGELIKQTAGYGEFPPGSPEASAERAKMGMLGMGSELAMPPVVGAIKKTVGPFAGRITEEGKRVMQLAKDWMLPISPASINPSLPAKATEAIVNKMPIVNWVTKFYQNRLRNNLTKVATDLRQNYSDEAIERIQGEITEAYEQAFRQIKQPKIKIKNFINALETAYPNMSKTAKDSVNAIRIEMGNTETVSRETAAQFKRMIGTLSQVGNKGKKNLDLSRQFNKALIEDIARTDRGEVVIPALREADETYTYVAAKKKLNKIFNRSFEFIRGDPVEKFNVGKFEKVYKDDRSSLLKKMPEIVEQLDNLLLVSKAAKTDLARLGEKAQLWDVAVGSGAIVSGLLGKPSTSVPIGLGALGARSFMAQRGLLRKFLTGGFEFPESRGFQEGLKLGARYIAMPKENK